MVDTPNFSFEWTTDDLTITIWNTPMLRQTDIDSTWFNKVEDNRRPTQVYRWNSEMQRPGPSHRPSCHASGSWAEAGDGFRQLPPMGCNPLVRAILMGKMMINPWILRRPYFRQTHLRTDSLVYMPRRTKMQTHHILKNGGKQLSAAHSAVS